MNKEASEATWTVGNHRIGWKEPQEGNWSKLLVKTGPALTLYEVAYGLCQNLSHHDNKQVFERFIFISLKKVNIMF